MNRPHVHTALHGMAEGEDAFQLKQIQWNEKRQPIVLQNSFGPCPLIALANCLALRGDLSLAQQARSNQLPQSALVNAVADAITSFGARSADAQQNLNDALNCLPNLLHGLDLNVRFNSVDAFEFTGELSVFDLVHVPLLHGWVVDPSDEITATAIGQRSYNQVVEHLIRLRESYMEQEQQQVTHSDSSSSNMHLVSLHLFANELDDAAYVRMRCADDSFSAPASLEQPRTQHEDANTHDEIAACTTLTTVENSHHVSVIIEEATPQPTGSPGSPEERSRLESGGDKHAHASLRGHSVDLLEIEALSAFLENTSSQLTHAGLEQLHERVNENCIFTLFRNNHFNSAIKRNGRIYLLVTDQGYAMEPSVVWELLSSVDGNTMLCDVNFNPAFPSSITEGNLTETEECIHQSAAVKYEGFSDLQKPNTTSTGALVTRTEVAVDSLQSAEMERVEQEQGDLALALHLQEEERNFAQQQQQQRQRQEGTETRANRQHSNVQSADHRMQRSRRTASSSQQQSARQTGMCNMM